MNTERERERERELSRGLEWKEDKLAISIKRYPGVGSGSSDVALRTMLPDCTINILRVERENKEQVTMKERKGKKEKREKKG